MEWFMPRILTILSPRWLRIVVHPSRPKRAGRNFIASQMLGLFGRVAAGSSPLAAPSDLESPIRASSVARHT